MKRNELTPGQHVLVSSGQNWQAKPYTAERWVILDTTPWNNGSTWTRTTKDVPHPDGGTVQTYASRSPKGSTVLAQRLTNDGQPHPVRRVAEPITLGSIRGPWESTYADVVAASERAQQERQRKVRAETEAFTAAAVAAQRVRVALGRPHLFLPLSAGAVTIPADLLGELLDLIPGAPAPLEDEGQVTWEHRP